MSGAPLPGSQQLVAWWGGILLKCGPWASSTHWYYLGACQKCSLPSSQISISESLGVGPEALVGKSEMHRSKFQGGAGGALRKSDITLLPSQMPPNCPTLRVKYHIEENLGGKNKPPFR